MIDNITLPPHKPTRAIKETLDKYLGADDREYVWESIQAYADVQARAAVEADRQYLAAEYRKELDKLSTRNYELRMENAKLVADRQKRLPAASAEPCRAALAELVACKDLKDKRDFTYDSGPRCEFSPKWRADLRALQNEYNTRKPAAWAAARAALAGSTAPVAQEPVAEVLSSRKGNDTSTIDKALPDGTKLYTAPVAAQPSVSSDTRREALLDVIRRLNSNPYSLTKSECIIEVEAMLSKEAKE